MENEKTTVKTDKEKLVESFYAALMPAGIVLGVLLLLWIPFKVVPYMIGNGTNFVSTTLSSMLISEDEKPSTTTNMIVGNSLNKEKAPAPVQKKYSGYPDLEIILIAMGVIDRASNQFIETNYAGYNDEIAIRFQVKNAGTNVSGAWKLRINTPSRTTPNYDSVNQVSIKPGDRMIFTTTFDSPVSMGINTAYITADPLNEVTESNDSNNLLQVPIKVEGTNYTYANNYSYGSYVPVPNVYYGTTYTWTNISVNCYATPDITSVGRPVTWYASVSGGNGYYSYSWTGSDSLYSNEHAISKVYYTPGTKMATITVSSNGQTVSRQCSTNVVY